MRQNSYNILANGNPASFWNSTNVGGVYVYFAYPHSTYEVVTIPENTRLIALPLLSPVSVPTLVRRRRLRA